MEITKKLLSLFHILNFQTLIENLWIHLSGIKKIRFINYNNEKIFITGGAGFIGYNAANFFLKKIQSKNF